MDEAGSKAFSFEKPMYLLLSTEPFYAHFLMACRIKLNVPKVETLGVMVKKGAITMVINTEFFNKLKIKEQAAVLKHEMMHVLLGHCEGRGKAYKANHILANVAMDCAINQHISDLPEGCVTLDTLEKKLEHPLKPYETFEYYYAALMASDKIKEEMVNNHEFMEGSDSEGEFEAAQNRNAIGRAAKDAMKAAVGKVPSGIEKALADLTKDSQVSWRQILRNIVSSTPFAEKRNTRKKVHRRFELDQPGKRRKRKLKVAVCADSSGSVSDESYTAFMKEIMSISRNTAVTYLIEADCEIQNVKKITGTAKLSDLTVRHGSGGTAYQPAITKAVELKVDLIIYFGDMDSADYPENPGVPFIWVRVGDQKPPGDFGRVVDLTA